MKRDFLDQIEQQLVDATERGGKRQRFWHRKLRLPTFAAAGVAVTAVTATALAAHLVLPVHHKPTATSTTPPLVSTGGAGGAVAGATAPPAGPVPAGFQPQSFTAVSDFTWWLLGQAPCSSPPCTSIVRTDNGGKSFVGIPAPRTDAVDQLRFADPQDGYAFGTELWVTTDAGHTWQQVDLGGDVVDVEPGLGYVYALVRDSSGTGWLMRAATGSSDWTKLSGAGNVQGGLWVNGSDVLVEAESAAADGFNLISSSDDGTSFTQHAAPPAVACRFEGQAGGTIWEPCATGMMSGIWRSTDGGATLTAVGGDATNTQMQLPNSASFAAASADTAVVGFQQLYRTVDAGSTWSLVPGPAVSSTSNPDGLDDWTYIGFTDTTHGVAIGLFGSGSSQTYRLYYTVDAGASYHLVPITPA